MKFIQYIAFFALIFSCSTTQSNVETKLKDNQTFEIKEISTNPSYGFTENNHIQVGGVDKNEGPLNQRRFLNALAGPNGEEISYERLGSCCPVKSKNDPFGTGKVMLDLYQVTWENADVVLTLYINMYDYGNLKAPMGLTIKN